MRTPRLAEQLGPDVVEAMLDQLSVRLATRLSPPASDPYPPGALDYWATYCLGWDLTQEMAEAEYRLLADYADTSGVPVNSEFVDLPVGRGHFVVIDLLEPELWDSLDAREADLEYLASNLLQDGELDGDLEQSLTAFESFALLVNSVSVDPRWRGLKIGITGTALALHELRRGCSFAALDAMEPGTAGDMARAASHERLASYWGRLGFKPWRGRVLVLDLGTKAFGTSLSALGLGDG